ncbi:UDP-glucuronosyl/UDP-glucosyltransferase [Trema orientale]|uniref:UDP-glucuronosyl/UDP-glucosyltransferase n=1 Tax=Trema orientale TaxID=63057 RepID=A0A2P5ED73_TREOI|nr:UDP-glucuronosyl/UDP-glucosyltransferase [Trema orientale]
MISKQRVLVLPFPAQGHVKPLMLFSHKLAKQGFRITFVNSDFNYNRIISSAANKADHDEQAMGSQIDMVSIPDGFGPDDDRAQLGPLYKGILDTMPAKLEQLIATINGSATAESRNDKITCVVCDVNMGWALEVAAKMGVRGASFCTTSAAMFVHMMKIMELTKMAHPETMDNSDESATKKEKINQLPAGIPDMENIEWNLGDLDTMRITTEYMLKVLLASKTTDWWLCNTIYDIEPAALSLLPKLLPIGPLRANETTGPGDISGSQFWAEDNSCLSWLDQQKPCSVIYVAFGSFTVHDQGQFHELALGLELTSRPFLWVVRPGFISKLGQDDAFDPDELQSNKKNNNNIGKIVNWAPQQKVLGHPSIACFVSHCGWNSTIEGLSNGVPFLCWPYFADQIPNKRYICDIWKVGLGFESNKKGIISSEEVKNKVDQLLGDVDIRRRSLELKEMVLKNIAEDGQSSMNFNNFIQWLEKE